LNLRDGSIATYCRRFSVVYTSCMLRSSRYTATKVYTAHTTFQDLHCNHSISAASGLLITLIMKAASSSETSVNFQQTTWHSNPEERHSESATNWRETNSVAPTYLNGSSFAVRIRYYTCYNVDFVITWIKTVFSLLKQCGQ
jgi:hypothetical protein